MKLLCALLLAAWVTPSQSAIDEFDRGVEAFKTARYTEATQHLKRASELDPASSKTHLYLGMVYLTQWVPGAQSAENQENYNLATGQLQRALDLNPKNADALAMMASMAYSLATTSLPGEQDAALEKARMWNVRRIELDPRDPEPYYFLGVIGWSQVYSGIQAQRLALKIPAAEPGPIQDETVRHQLQRKYLPKIKDGIAQLTQCISLDKDNEDAMAYLNLLLRKKADLEDSADAAQNDIKEADDWVKRSMETRQGRMRKTESTDGISFDRVNRAIFAPPPPPPPPPPPTPPPQAH